MASLTKDQIWILVSSCFDGNMGILMHKVKCPENYSNLKKNSIGY